MVFVKNLSLTRHGLTFRFKNGFDQVLVDRDIGHRVLGVINPHVRDVDEGFFLIVQDIGNASSHRGNQQCSFIGTGSCLDRDMDLPTLCHNIKTPEFGRLARLLLLMPHSLS